MARVVGDASEQGLRQKLGTVREQGGGERRLDRARTGVQFKSSHLVSEEQGM